MKLSDDSLKEIDMYSLDAPQTRKSLVKGERFIRSVWRAWVDDLFWHLVVKEIWRWQESFDFWTFYICKPYQKQDDPQFRLKPLWHFDSYRFSAFWLRSKCSICSYQLNIWYEGHVPSSILTPSGPTSERGLLARGGALRAPPTKSMKELFRTIRCYLEIGPL